MPTATTNRTIQGLVLFIYSQQDKYKNLRLLPIMCAKINKQQEIERKKQH